MAKKEKPAPPPPNPDVVAALQLAHGHYEAGRLEDSKKELKKALAIEPDHFDAAFSLGVVYRDLERLDDAIATFTKLDGKQPLKQAGIDNNLGVIADRQNQHEKAIEFYRKAIDREFQFAQAHLNLAFTLLKTGQFEEGWLEHEWRWQTNQFTPVRCLQPRWNGEELDGTLLLHTEQGSGDTFQFLRFLPEIRRRCKKVMLMVPEHLKSIIQPGGWADEMVSVGNVPLDQFQAILPLMTAPHALKCKGDFSSDLVPYLKPEERQVDLGEPHVPDAKLKVGICWGGSVTHANDKFRSCSLAQLAPIFDVPEVAFYSIQKGPQVAEIAELGNGKIRDTDPLQKDFADAAAILKQMDVTISVDTSVLHLAGGLGLPAWGLLSTRSDWRWGLASDKTAWYPTISLYRQATCGDWDELAKRVAADLQKVVKGEVEA